MHDVLGCMEAGSSRTKPALRVDIGSRGNSTKFCRESRGCPSSSFQKGKEALVEGIIVLVIPAQSRACRGARGGIHH